MQNMLRRVIDDLLMVDDYRDVNTLRNKTT